MSTSLAFSQYFGNILSKEELLHLEKIGRERVFHENDTIIAEGDPSNSFFLIEKGEVEVVKEEYLKGQKLEVHLATLGEGELFGEIAFVEGIPRTATVKAKKPTVLYEVEKEPFMENPSLFSLHQKVLKHIFSKSVHKLRGLNEQYVSHLRQSVDQLKDQKAFGVFTLINVLSFCVILILQFLFKDVTFDPKGEILTTVKLFCILGLFFFYVTQYRYPTKEIGLTLEKWPKMLMLGFGASLIPLLIIFVYYRISTGLSFVELFDQLLNFPYSFIFMIFYFFHSFGQEFFMRGVIQYSLRRFLRDEHGIWTVLFTTTFFVSGHAHHSLATLLIMGVGNIYLGVMYLRRNNLIYITMIHYMVGIVTLGLGENITLGRGIN